MRRRSHLEPAWARWALIALAALLLLALVVAPVATVFAGALGRGLGPYLAALATPETRAALKLTLEVAAFAVPANAAFGLAAAWLLTRHRLPGRGLLLALIDLPFSVPPVIAGLVYVLLFGRSGLLGPWLRAHDLQVIFALPGIVLATTFVTFPFVVREVLPLMQAQGQAEEEAALTLGASGLTVFLRVTLPKIKWALLYGLVLCNARAMGEFGAVSVVSGHVIGLTNTLPLHIEGLYNDYDFVGAFAVASLLTGLAVVTIVAKRLLGRAEEPS